MALASATLLFALGILDTTDLRRIDWDILILMWGGLAMGEGMERSGLAAWATGLPFFSQGGPLVFAGLCLLAVAISTFMSNTAAANLLLPLAVAAPGQDPVAMTIAVALCCSFDVPLPVSSPPNALAFATSAATCSGVFSPIRID